MRSADRLDDLPDRGLPEKRLVRKAFSRSAERYDTVAALQREVANALLSSAGARLSSPPRRVLDVGVGTGYCCSRVAERFPAAELVALDIALGMLTKTMSRLDLAGRVQPVCADAEALPIQDQRCDLVISNLALQWCHDLARAVGEFHRVLRPGGVAAFSTFTEGTLCELRDAWASVDSDSHVNRFLNTAKVREAILAAGPWLDPEIVTQRSTLNYPKVLELMRELKALGAGNVTEGRPRRLTGKGKWQRMLGAYPLGAGGHAVEASFVHTIVIIRKA